MMIQANVCNPKGVASIDTLAAEMMIQTWVFPQKGDGAEAGLIFSRPCVQCSKPVHSLRANAEFCSSACRQKHYRRKSAIRNECLNHAGISVTQDQEPSVCKGVSVTHHDNPSVYACVSVTLKDSVDGNRGFQESDLTEDEREIYEERAAIMEFDGGLRRMDAEAGALAEIQRKRAALI